MVKERGIVLLTSEINSTWLHLIKDSGLNKLGVHPNFGNDANSVEQTVSYINSNQGKEMLTLAKQLGIDIEYEIHAVNYLLPRELFIKYPKYFRMDKNGDRVAKENLCFSNKDAIEIVKKNAVKLARMLRPTTNKYYIWQDDYEDIFCHCDDCKQLSASDQNMILMNAIIEGINQVYPEAKLAYLAYISTIKQPIKIEPNKNIFLEFAPIHRDFKTHINDVNSKKNIFYIKELKKLIDVFGVNDGQILEYWLDCSLFSNWKKPAVKLPFNKEILKRDIEYYHSLGFESVTSFGVFLDDEYFKAFGVPPIKEYGEALYTSIKKVG